MYLGLILDLLTTFYKGFLILIYMATNIGIMAYLIRTTRLKNGKHSV